MSYTMTERDCAVIVGAGHAASELCTGLRGNGWLGRIVLIGAEACLPYQRPPLSKAYLSGEATAASLCLKPQAVYDKAGVEVMLGTRVTRIDRASRRITIDDGRAISYTKLALTTGGRARRLNVPGSDAAARLSNFHYLRTIGDVDRIREQFEPGMRLVIVGGGYIGLEVAAASIQRGMNVTVLEALPRVLARVTAPELSAFYERVHRDAGVDLRTGVEVRGFEFHASGDAVSALNCSDGSCLPADQVIVAVGLLPNTEIAEAAGLAVDNGIVVDEYACTADPDIVAAGDCTNQPIGMLGRRVRVESVPNAMEQARSAAAAMCGQHRPQVSVPWFWSDQYDLKLKMVGLSQGHDTLVLRGSPATRSFSAYYLERGRLLAVDTVNRMQEFTLAKRLVAESVAADPASLADESFDLKSLLSTATPAT